MKMLFNIYQMLFAIDHLTTRFVLKHGGAEANPLVQKAIDIHGLESLYFICMFRLILIWIAYKIYERSVKKRPLARRISIGAVLLGIFVQIVVDVNNIINMILIWCYR